MFCSNVTRTPTPRDNPKQTKQHTGACCRPRSQQGARWAKRTFVSIPFHRAAPTQKKQKKRKDGTGKPEETNAVFRFGLIAGSDSVYPQKGNPPVHMEPDCRGFKSPRPFFLWWVPWQRQANYPQRDTHEGWDSPFGLTMSHQYFLLFCCA